MKFDIEAFKGLMVLLLIVNVLFLIMALPACFNTPKVGSPNTGYTLFVGAIILIGVAIALIRYEANS